MMNPLKSKSDTSGEKELIPLNYSPSKMRIDSIIEETSDTKTFRLTFCDPEENEKFEFKPGQFGLYSIFGEGEATFCISSSPTRKGYIECSVKRMGKVTGELHESNMGDIIGFRGPYGNWFPLDQMKGKNIVFVAGGIGLAPVRSAIWNVLDRRGEFGYVTIVYGARSVDDLVYKRELSEWEKMSDVNFVKTVDPCGENKDWDGKIGFVPTVLEEAAPSPKDTFAIVCGPPIMIKFTFPVLTKLGFSPDRMITTLENRMKCGVGKCGRCNVGNKYVCKDGPVFSFSELQTLPPEY